MFRAAPWALARKFLCAVLCLAVSPLPALCAPQAAAPVEQRAGEIGALRPAATRNDAETHLKDDLFWNDLLKTDPSGRLRANLADGSILSLGSSSQLRVVQHDAASQQTSLGLAFGRLRSRVVKITKPGGKFEVTTPHAVIGVIGTDFYLFVDALRTLVIVYSGRVVVKRLKKSEKDPTQTVAVEPGTDLGPGQMLEVRGGPPTPGAGAEALTPEPTPSSVQHDSIVETNVEQGHFYSAWSTPKKLLIFGGIAAAAATVAAVAATRKSDKPPTCTCVP